MPDDTPDVTPHDGEGSEEKAGQEPKKEKVTFTPEQQLKLNELIDRGYAKGATRAKEEVTAEFARLLAAQETQIAELAKRLEAVMPAGKPADRAADKLEKPIEKPEPASHEEPVQLVAQVKTLRTTLASVEKEKADLLAKVQSFDALERDMKLRAAFDAATPDIAFIDPSEEFHLLRDRIGVDEQGEFFIKNEKTGRPLLNAHAEPMSLGEFLTDYAQRKPHKVRAPDQMGGTGSGETRRVPGNASRDVSRMTPEEFRAFKEKVKMGAV